MGCVNGEGLDERGEESSWVMWEWRVGRLVWGGWGEGQGGGEGDSKSGGIMRRGEG